MKRKRKRENQQELLLVTDQGDHAHVSANVVYVHVRAGFATSVGDAAVQASGASNGGSSSDARGGDAIDDGDDDRSRAKRSKTTIVLPTAAPTADRSSGSSGSSGAATKAGQAVVSCLTCQCVCACVRARVTHSHCISVNACASVSVSVCADSLVRWRCQDHGVYWCVNFQAVHRLFLVQVSGLQRSDGDGRRKGEGKQGGTGFGKGLSERVLWMFACWVQLSFKFFFVVGMPLTNCCTLNRRNVSV